ncbi:MAG: peptidoglycan bridge formation glycyltransferase FemA/FemB family protein [Tissierellales bacterium]|nr:peptidoglycan bridge formation glycyltransferase FemA/FemB family protein [Tissierellales bacterium]
MSALRVEEIFDTERDYWDKEISKFESVHPLNAFGWGKVRAIDGWEPTYLMAKKGSLVTGAVIVLTKPIPFTGLFIMYAPRGPVFNPSDKETLKVLLKGMRVKAKEKHAIFLRIDPNITEEAILKNGDPFIEQGFIHLKHRWTFWNTPRDVYRIDLSKSATVDEVFKFIQSKTRNQVRRADKLGVIIRSAESLSELDSFYKIFREFTVAKGFMARSYAYQKSLWEEYIKRGNGKLFLAVYENDIVGGLICLIFGKKCLDMHMGTPYKYQHLRTNNAYVWEAIKCAKEEGCTWFSFRGVGSSPTQEKFKSKFGPEVVALAGYYDLVFYPLLYRLFYMAEFEILPRVWPVLMHIRKKLSDIINWQRSNN